MKVRSKKQSESFGWAVAVFSTGLTLMAMSVAIWVGEWILAHADSVKDYLLYGGGVVAFLGFVAMAILFRDPDEEVSND